jgi:hypothetical protein
MCYYRPRRYDAKHVEFIQKLENLNNSASETQSSEIKKALACLQGQVELLEEFRENFRVEISSLSFGYLCVTFFTFYINSISGNYWIVDVQNRSRICLGVGSEHSSAKTFIW